MRLLVTRAAADAERTRRKLEALGHEVIVSPVIEMVATGAGWPQGVVDAVLATSAQAFCVPLQGLSPEARQLIPLFLVGARTEKMARADGFSGAAIVGKTAQLLAAHMRGTPSLPQRIVYLAGRDRKPDLEMALGAIGRTPEIREVYEAREATTPSSAMLRAFERRAIDGIMHYSHRSAGLLVEMAASHHLDVSRLTHFCLSDDSALPLRDAGATVRVAAAPSETDLLALIGPA